MQMKTHTWNLRVSSGLMASAVGREGFFFNISVEGLSKLGQLKVQSNITDFKGSGDCWGY
jgi:hypothetical protein